ncbi:MAG TPA: hypothetical protein DCE18_17505, partial [Syntrophobacteraceae bacterium]|nr:hypothetical protein [Syntrophobacteraceae bacterium]
CQRAGGFFIRNPKTINPHPSYLIPATNEIVQEFADLLAVVAAAAAAAAAATTTTTTAAAATPAAAATSGNVTGTNHIAAQFRLILLGHGRKPEFIGPGFRTLDREEIVLDGVEVVYRSKDGLQGIFGGYVGESQGNGHFRVDVFFHDEIEAGSLGHGVQNIPQGGIAGRQIHPGGLEGRDVLVSRLKFRGRRWRAGIGRCWDGKPGFVRDLNLPRNIPGRA